MWQYQGKQNGRQLENILKVLKSKLKDYGILARVLPDQKALDNTSKKLPIDNISSCQWQKTTLLGSAHTAYYTNTI